MKIYIIEGPQGCGKSTLVRAITSENKKDYIEVGGFYKDFPVEEIIKNSGNKNLKFISFEGLKNEQDLISFVMQYRKELFVKVRFPYEKSVTIIEIPDLIIETQKPIKFKNLKGRGIVFIHVKFSKLC